MNSKLIEARNKLYSCQYRSQEYFIALRAYTNTLWGREVM